MAIVTTAYFVIGWSGFRDLLKFHRNVILGSGMYGGGDQIVVDPEGVRRAIMSIPGDRTYALPLALIAGGALFLAGLVTLGSLQTYWLKPLITSLDGAMLYFGATALTAITDNAALTFLGSQVPMSPELKYALVAGSVSGGGLTVIANAPNPAGAGILRSSKAFGDSGIHPVGLFLGATPPTLMAIAFFWFIA